MKKELFFQLALFMLSFVVALKLLAGENAWLFIVAYWIVLTVKNLIAVAIKED